MRDQARCPQLTIMLLLLHASCIRAEDREAAAHVCNAHCACPEAPSNALQQVMLVCFGFGLGVAATALVMLHAFHSTEPPQCTPSIPIRTVTLPEGALKRQMRDARVQGPATYLWWRATPRFQVLGDRAWGAWFE